MVKQRRGRGDTGSLIPRMVYEHIQPEESLPNPRYRPPRTLRTDQTCYVCATVIPAGATGVTWAPARRQWRHTDCPSDQAPPR